MTLRIKIEVPAGQSYGMSIVDTYNKIAYWLVPGDSHEYYIHSAQQLLITECSLSDAQHMKEKNKNK